jgi:hypothetical protein
MEALKTAIELLVQDIELPETQVASSKLPDDQVTAIAILTEEYALYLAQNGREFAAQQEREQEQQNEKEKQKQKEVGSVDVDVEKQKESESETVERVEEDVHIVNSSNGKVAEAALDDDDDAVVCVDHDRVVCDARLAHDDGPPRHVLSEADIRSAVFYEVRAAGKFPVLDEIVKAVSRRLGVNLTHRRDDIARFVNIAVNATDAYSASGVILSHSANGRIARLYPERQQHIYVQEAASLLHSQPFLQWLNSQLQLTTHATAATAAAATTPTAHNDSER